MRITFKTFDEMLPLSKLKKSKHQRNKHPQDQIIRLAKIMEAHGVRHPIHISRLSGQVCFGHGRWEAAKLNKYTEYPIVYQDFKDDDEEYACVQSDNAIASWAELDLAGINLDIVNLGPDFDIDLLGIKDFVLEPADKHPGCDEDEVPEQVDATAKLGDIWALGEHRLMCGDSTSKECFQALAGKEEIELCFTSPPYSDQRDYNGGKELHPDKLASFITASVDSVKYYAVNLGYSRKEGEVIPYWDYYINKAKGNGLKLLSWNIWDKGECGSVGNQTAMFGISHEWIFVFGKKKKDLNRTVENISAGYLANHNGNRQRDGSIKKQRDRIVGSHSQLKTVYSCSAQKARDDINHPARFPVSFAEGYVSAMTNESEIVYDPFGGSGSTLIACEKTNRKCFMMEIDPHYCDVIVARWEKYTNKKAVLLNGKTQTTIRRSANRKTSDDSLSER